MGLKESLQSFQDCNYTRVKRGNESYADTLKITKSELSRYVDLYNQGGNVQHLRLIRDAIDHWIRRYHGYTIGGSIGSHYVQDGVDLKNCIFEHVVPASKVRDMLIANVLDIDQALAMPTCLINQDADLQLRKQGLVSSTPNYWTFFERYASIGAKFKTYDGKVQIDLVNWTLQNHLDYFKQSVV